MLKAERATGARRPQRLDFAASKLSGAAGAVVRRAPWRIRLQPFFHPSAINRARSGIRRQIGLAAACKAVALSSIEVQVLSDASPKGCRLQRQTGGLQNRLSRFKSGHPCHTRKVGHVARQAVLKTVGAETLLRVRLSHLPLLTILRRRRLNGHGSGVLSRRERSRVSSSLTASFFFLRTRSSAESRAQPCEG